MSRKRIRRVKVTNEDLTKRHAEWLMAGPLLMNGPKFAKPGAEGVRVDEKGNIVFKHYNKAQVHSYGYDGLRRYLTIVACGLEDETIPVVQDMIGKRLQGIPSRYRHKAKLIFDLPPIVAHRGVEADKEFYEGVGIEVPISRVPQGTHGGLSDNLYIYTYNLFSLPMFKLAWGGEWKDFSAWYDFSGPERSPWKREIVGGGSIEDSRSA